MTPGTLAALFSAMLVLAFVPGISALTVSSRSASFGFAHGVAVTLGIVIGDVVFIALTIYGLSYLNAWLGSLFTWVKYIGGAYLIWLGIGLWRTMGASKVALVTKDTSLTASFLAGLLITLGDQKAVLFYLGFLPAFVDLTSVSFRDVSLLIAVATLAVAGAKLTYALVAEKASLFVKNANANQLMNRVAGSLMIGVGVFLIL